MSKDIKTQFIHSINCHKKLHLDNAYFIEAMTNCKFHSVNLLFQRTFI